MIQKALNILDKNFMKVNILTGVRRVQNAFYEKNINCFAAYDDEKLVGVVTQKELVAAHPNRIIADAMTDKYRCIDCSTPTWKVKEIFDSNKDLCIIFVKENNDLKGFLTRTILNIELAKHIDLLTGLYKSDYIFYNTYKLINNGNELSLIFIDLNNFGTIDKKYGHINGDLVLKNVAKILRENVTKDSYLCRYAGDEFAILTPFCIDKCKLFAEKLINAINSYKFPNNIPVSASIGITGYKNHNSKTGDTLSIINKLINIASLASTKAKKKVNTSIIVENTTMLA
ncbi:diguanylate cyclase [Clostridium sp. JS66]|uniref:diguanylate cyclase n=1 Tax=Clostridium sp. JS66 TaxID=3064705 RepID=UPI00399B6805